MSESLQLTVNIVSPERLVFSGEASYVSVPGADGVIGILPKHAPLITALDCGKLVLYAGNKDVPSDSFIVSGGFAEITGERCTILADFAVRKGDVNTEDYRARLESLNAEIKHTRASEQSSLNAEIKFLEHALAA